MITNPRIAKFIHEPPVYRCPVCGNPLRVQSASLVCERGHTADIAAKGYVSLLRRPVRTSALYDRDFFEHRAQVFAQGLYAHITAAVIDALGSGLGTGPSPASDEARQPPWRIMDAGCGDGSVLHSLATSWGVGVGVGRGVGVGSAADDRRSHADLLGFDISRDAVSIAARGGGPIEWFVGDLAHIPVLNHTVDAVINVFSPANYAEFARILRPGGVLVKAIPGPGHLAELRAAIAQAQGLGDWSYDNQQVLSDLGLHAQITSSATASRTVPLDPESLDLLLGMTPLMFHVDSETLDRSLLTSITIEAQVVTATLASTVES